MKGICKPRKTYLEHSNDAGFTAQTDSKQLICRWNSTAGPHFGRNFGASINVLDLRFLDVYFNTLWVIATHNTFLFILVVISLGKFNNKRSKTRESKQRALTKINKNNNWKWQLAAVQLCAWTKFTVSWTKSQLWVYWITKSWFYFTFSIALRNRWSRWTGVK